MAILRWDHNYLWCRCCLESKVGHDLHSSSCFDKFQFVRYNVQAECFTILRSHVLKDLPWPCKIDHCSALGHDECHVDLGTIKRWVKHGEGFFRSRQFDTSGILLHVRLRRYILTQKSDHTSDRLIELGTWLKVPKTST